MKSVALEVVTAVRRLTLIAVVIVLGLSVVLASKVPSWCDASLTESSTVCRTQDANSVLP